MKKLVFLVLLFPLFSFGQLDFGSFTGKIDLVSLPEIESLGSLSFSDNSGFILKNSNKLPSFKLNKNNYREPVSMLEAMASAENYVESNIQISLDPKSLGIYGGSSNYSADGSTKVKNTVYKEANSGFWFAGSCPPYGVCPRCAPYRVGHSFY